MHTKKTNNTNKLIQISYHFVLTKIQKLQNLKKKKKKTFFCTGRYAQYRPVLPEIGRYEVGTAGIFSGTKQGGRTYRIAGRYDIFRPYRPVRYGIDNISNFTDKVTPKFFNLLLYHINVILLNEFLPNLHDNFEWQWDVSIRWKNQRMQSFTK